MLTSHRSLLEHMTDWTLLQTVQTPEPTDEERSNNEPSGHKRKRKAEFHDVTSTYDAKKAKSPVTKGGQFHDCVCGRVEHCDQEWPARASKKDGSGYHQCKACGVFLRKCDQKAATDCKCKHITCDRCESDCPAFISSKGDACHMCRSCGNFLWKCHEYKNKFGTCKCGEAATCEHHGKLPTRISQKGKTFHACPKVNGKECPGFGWKMCSMVRGGAGGRGVRGKGHPSSHNRQSRTHEVYSDDDTPAPEVKTNKNMDKSDVDFLAGAQKEIYGGGKKGKKARHSDHDNSDDEETHSSRKRGSGSDNDPAGGDDDDGRHRKKSSKQQKKVVVRSDSAEREADPSDDDIMNSYAKAMKKRAVAAADESSSSSLSSSTAADHVPDTEGSSSEWKHKRTKKQDTGSEAEDSDTPKKKTSKSKKRKTKTTSSSADIDTTTAPEMTKEEELNFFTEKEKETTSTDTPKGEVTGSITGSITQTFL